MILGKIRILSYIFLIFLIPKIVFCNEKVVKLMGLDKITAKTTEIKVKIGETKKFGLI